MALLLISADFLASEFIANNELPPLLRAVEERGAVVLSLIVSPSLFSYNNDLSQFHAVNNPSKPLISISKGEQEEVFVHLAETIRQRHLAQLPKSENGIVSSSSNSRERFLDNRNWTRLITIGDWILDERGKRFIGAGMNTFLLSRYQYGPSKFNITAKLSFSNFSQYLTERLNTINAGFILGWNSEYQAPRYYNILITGTVILLERVGFPERGAEHLTEGVPFELKEDKFYQFDISVHGQSIKILIGGEHFTNFELPNRIHGRVGIRPWRSQIDCKEFVIEGASSTLTDKGDEGRDTTV